MDEGLSNAIALIASKLGVEEAVASEVSNVVLPEAFPGTVVRPKGRRPARSWEPIATKKPAGYCLHCHQLTWTFNDEARPQHVSCDPALDPVDPGGPTRAEDAGPCSVCGRPCRKYGLFGRQRCLPCRGEGDEPEILKAEPIERWTRSVPLADEWASSVMTEPCQFCKHAVGVHVKTKRVQFGWAIYDQVWARAKGACGVRDCNCRSAYRPARK